MTNEPNQIITKSTLLLNTLINQQNLNAIFLFLTHKNPNKATGGEPLESTRNATIGNGERLSDYIEVSDELLTLGDYKKHV